VFDISPIQILIVLVIALLVFGPKRLPEMGRSVGRGIREFKGAILDDDDDAPRRPASAGRPDPSGRGPEEQVKPPAAATAATATPPPDGDDVLEGVIVPGDAPPRSSDS
jgi:sec-independent protein translocase protein TatA